MTSRALTIYFKNGSTGRFEQVTDVKHYHDGVELTFNYVSASRPGVAVSASFTRSNIAGYSVDV